MEQKTSKTKVLVTGVGGPAGINIIRLLKQKNDIEVIGCDIDELATGQLFVDEFLLSPRVSDFPAYKKWLTDTVTEIQPDMLIPTVDEELFPLSTFVSEFDCFVPLSAGETLHIAADKVLAYEFVKEKLPQHAPAATTLANWTEDWRSDIEFFIKPRKGRGARGCRVVERKELIWLKENLSNSEDIVVMETLPGTEWTVDAYVSQNGDLSYLIPRERLGLSGGISIKGRSVKNSEVENATKELLALLPMRGPVCVQWKQDKQGAVKFIEVNPRLSGGLQIGVLSGTDPVQAFLDDYHNEPARLQEWSETTVVGHFEYKKLA